MSSGGLDMSLDDLIKSNKKSTTSDSNPRPRGRFSGASGPTRRFNDRFANRPSPYAALHSKAPDSAWKHDMYSGHVQAGRAVTAIETGTKIFISNLDYGVSNEDIKELFSEVGGLKRFSVHYDRSGRSMGTADVVFSRRQDALAALKRYNNVQLDGRPMKIEIKEADILKPPAPPVPNWGFGNSNSAPGRLPNSFPVRGGFNGLSRGSGRGRGRGRGKGRGRAEPVSAADLDADLEKYHSESMQIN